MTPSRLVALQQTVTGKGGADVSRKAHVTSGSVSPGTGEAVAGLKFSEILTQSSQSTTDKAGKLKTRKSAVPLDGAKSAEKAKSTKSVGSDPGNSLILMMSGLQLSGVTYLPVQSGVKEPVGHSTAKSAAGSEHAKALVPGRDKVKMGRGLGTLGVFDNKVSVSTRETGAHAVSVTATELPVTSSPKPAQGEGTLLASVVSGIATNVRDQRTIGARGKKMDVATAHPESTPAPRGSNAILAPTSFKQEGIQVRSVSYKPNSSRLVTPPNSLSTARVGALVLGPESAKTARHESPTSVTSKVLSGVSSAPPLASEFAAQGSAAKGIQERALAGFAKIGQKATGRHVSSDHVLSNATSNSVAVGIGNGSQGLEATTPLPSTSSTNATLMVMGRDTPAQLAAMAANLANSAQGQLQVKVQPEGMGTLVVTAAKHENGISVQLMASSAATASLLSAATLQIQEGMRNLGLQVAGVVVAQSQGFSLADQQQSQGRRERRGPSGQRVAPTALGSSRSMPVVEKADNPTRSVSHASINVQA